MSTSESFRGNVPAALEELRQPRSGGCLVWFFELLWAYCPESRGLKGTDSQPGLMHQQEGDDDNDEQQHQQQTSNKNNNNNKFKRTTHHTTTEGPQAPDVLWRMSSSSSMPNHHNRPNSGASQNNNNNTSVFGTWDENPDEIDTAEADEPHDDFLWLPVLPPTVLLNFSRIQSWYFTPKTRMQMQREIAFYSVADEDESAKMYSRQQQRESEGDFSGGGGGGGEGGNSSSNNSGLMMRDGPVAQNDIDRLLMQFHEKEKENKKKRESSIRNKLREVPSYRRNNNNNNTDFSFSGANEEPEHQFTLGQRQVLGIRAIAERYKKEHSSNADELPAPVLKRLRGRLSTSVIVDAFEREYTQGLKVENVTSHCLAMAQAQKDKNKSEGGGGGGGGLSALAQMMSSMEDEENGKKKKRKANIRHVPSGWTCPEGPEQKELQYDRIVAQLIRKAPDQHSSSSGGGGGGSHHHDRRRNQNSRNSNNNKHSSYLNNNNSDDDEDDDMLSEDGSTNNSNNLSSMMNRINKSKRSNSSFKSLPTAARTAELLTSSLCSPYIEYLTMESLRRVLCSGTLGQAALLQQFVPPPPPTAIGNARYNETLDFRWQPRWRYLERCTNSNALDDWTVPASKRGPTFEGPPGSSVGAMLGHATLYRLERACRAIVRHVFNVSQHTARILRLHCIFKFDERLSLVLLCVVEAYAINPRAIPPATTIANILNADAHLPRFKTAQAQQRQQEQLQQLQLAQQQQAQQQQQQQLLRKQGSETSLLSSSAASNNNKNSRNNLQQRRTTGSSNNLLARVNSGLNGSGSNDDNASQQQNIVTREERAQYLHQRQQQNASRLASVMEEEVTATGWEPAPLDQDDIRRSPIRAVAAMSRGEARHAAIKKTMMERVHAIQVKKERRMIVDTQGVVKPIEQLRKEADAAFAAMNPKAAKDLDALFTRRDRRRALMKAGNSSAFEEANNNSNANTSNHQNSSNNMNDDDDDSENNSSHHQHYSSTTPEGGGNKHNQQQGGRSRKRRAINPLNEASETVDDLLWGRQSQLARALLRPVASREEARKLPFHRRPARSLAAECGASNVGERYIKTMRSASTPEPHQSNNNKNSSGDVRNRRAFC